MPCLRRPTSSRFSPSGRVLSRPPSPPGERSVAIGPEVWFRRACAACGTDRRRARQRRAAARLHRRHLHDRRARQRHATALRDICAARGMPFVSNSPFDKANRTADSPNLLKSLTEHPFSNSRGAVPAGRSCPCPHGEADRANCWARSRAPNRHRTTCGTTGARRLRARRCAASAARAPGGGAAVG